MLTERARCDVSHNEKPLRTHDLLNYFSKVG